LSHIQGLRLFSNKLTNLPTHLGRLRRVSDFTLYSNQITGTIPTELANIPTVGAFRVANNLLTGKFCLVLLCFV
jgi:hypothetical protein